MWIGVTSRLFQDIKLLHWYVWLTGELNRTTSGESITAQLQNCPDFLIFNIILNLNGYTSAVSELSLLRILLKCECQG